MDKFLNRWTLEELKQFSNEQTVELVELINGVITTQ